jgi:hypothetical protein
MTEADDLQAFNAVNMADAVRVCADPVMIDAAYRRVFGGVEGHAVLLDLMSQSGLSMPRGPDVGGESRAYYDGAQGQVSYIMARLGLGAAAGAAVLLGGLKAAVAPSPRDPLNPSHNPMAQEPNHDRYDPNAGPSNGSGTEWDEPGPADIAD